MKNHLLLAFFLVLVGCNQEFDDISDAQKYSRYINNKYQLIKELNLLSISTNKDGNVDVYVLDVSKAVKHSSPEIMSKDSLASGSIIEVHKVLKCTNCLFGTPIKFSVNVLGDRLPVNQPIYLSFELKDDIEKQSFSWLQEQ